MGCRKDEIPALKQRGMGRADEGFADGCEPFRFFFADLGKNVCKVRVCSREGRF